MAHGELAHANGVDHGCGCACRCGCVPAEFVRMRYFYGQLLGATDLSDEQAYSVGKHRFHNARLHGWGVLCGLRAERYTPPAGTATATTIIRVLRGAAIDHGGNEIIVPGDYCIDVNAWFLARKPSADDLLVDEKEEDEVEGEEETKTPRGRVYVVVRYHECPSEPSFAPRDPCGCSDDGCEFARVRESFTLDLITAKQLKDAPQEPPFPWGPAGEGLETLADPTCRSLRERASAPCPTPCGGKWLVLAQVDIDLDIGVTKVTDIDEPDNAAPLRRVLLSTAALQSAAVSAAAVGAQRGPTILQPQLLSPTQVRLPLMLITPAGATEPSKIEPASLDISFFTVTLFSPGSDPAWTAPALGVPAADPSGAAIDLTLPAAEPLADGDIFRITVDQDPAAPICDAAGRALTPLTWARTFVVKSTDTGLILADLAG